MGHFFIPNMDTMDKNRMIIGLEAKSYEEKMKKLECLALRIEYYVGIEHQVMEGCSKHFLTARAINNGTNYPFNTCTDTDITDSHLLQIFQFQSLHKNGLDVLSGPFHLYHSTSLLKHEASWKIMAS